jgi:hypothetical protein
MAPIIEKTAKAQVSGGVFGNLEEATAFVVAQRKARGLPV